MIYTDSHMHTEFSSDSGTPMEEQIKASIEKGLASICFTDHYDMDFPPLFDDGIDFQLDIPAYLKEFHRLKELYRNKIDLRIGIELGIQPGLSEKLHTFLKEYEGQFDFVLGSTHLVDKMDPYLPDYYGSFEKEEDGIRRYFEENMKNLKEFDQMDSFGHLDYVVRYAPNKDRFYVPTDHMDLIDPFLRLLIEKGVALEFNTANFKCGMENGNPHIDILRHYRSLGGELLTIGADGHVPDKVAFCFDKGHAILKEAGFLYYTIYRNRKPEMIKL